MDWLILLAAKSFLIAGGALILLKLLGKRSAADRSWIAHLALAGLLVLPVATFALPTLDVAGPEFLVGKSEAVAPASAPPVNVAVKAGTAATAPVAGPGVVGAPIDWAFWTYALPAALLILLTLIAIARLFVLKARAKVLVDAPWLTALARAQQRMGFKHGTALLTSTELPSPISWGLLRPVILLNAEAARSHEEAEAIITHELAHVARLDWAKLLLARVTVALFWFNPFVWLIAREAHQLREEAADDAVLAADIEDTDYARLLVDVARHECRGLLIGAHGVAPARNSLARRVKRVLDGAVRRAPGGWRWGSAVAFFAAGMSVPVAALNLVPAQPASSANPLIASAADPYHAPPADQAPLPPEQAAKAAQIVAEATISARRTGTMDLTEGQTILRSPSGAVITIGSPDSAGHRRTILTSPDGKTLEFADARAVPGLSAALAHPLPPAPPRPPRPENSAIDRAIEMKAVGVTPEYVAAIRAAAPQLRLAQRDLVQLKAVGVTPTFLQELSQLGYRNDNAQEITSAYAVGVRPEYIIGLANAGYGRLSLRKLTQLRALGVTVAYIESFRSAGITNLDVDRLVQLKALGVTPEELKASEDFGR
jgi:bla regulator protein blaR1